MALNVKIAKYLKQVDKYLADAEAELKEKDLVQASEKYWGAASQAVKAVAELKGWRHDGHALLFKAVERLSETLKDEELRIAFAAAHLLHINFYENWLDKGSIAVYSSQVKKFIRKMKSMVNLNQK